MGHQVSLLRLLLAGVLGVYLLWAAWVALKRLPGHPLWTRCAVAGGLLVISAMVLWAGFWVEILKD